MQGSKKVLESSIERKCKKIANENRIRFEKLSSPTWVGFPDRTLFIPGGRIIFIEFKRPGGKPRPTQVECHKELKRYGQNVYVIDSVEDFEILIKELICNL